MEGDKYDLEVIEQFKKYEVIGQPARVIFLYTFNIRFFFICLLFFLTNYYIKQFQIYSKKINFLVMIIKFDENEAIF